MRRLALATIATALLLLSSAADIQAQGLRAGRYASGFENPVAIVQDPTDRTVQFVVEQSGRIFAVRAGVRLDPVFLDLRPSVLSGGERGLLGMAFAPDYAASGRFFVNFTDRPNGNTVVARFRRSPSNAVVADASSRFDLRWGGEGGTTVVVQPFANHNGGHLAFGPDGFLYIGLGDGGSANDPAHRAQNPAELLGKMLRIDVGVPDSDPIGYRVPSDNPFVSAGPPGVRREIWSFGLRNPWRYNFDLPSRGGSGALIIGDVGQGALEEIDYEPAGRGGRNYGWRNREGSRPNVPSPPPAFTPLVDPIFEYDRSVGQSVTGGYVYRGRALGEAFAGRYFFADFVRGRIWSIRVEAGSTGEGVATDLREHTAELGTPGSVSSFGLDADGELFIVAYAGTIWRILGAAVAPATPTGLRIIR